MTPSRGGYYRRPLARSDDAHPRGNDRLAPTDAVRVLDAVDGTLDARRNDALEIDDTPEIREIIQRIDIYKGHLPRQRSVFATPQ